MTLHFIDAYRNKQGIVLWVKENGINKRLTRPYNSFIYADNDYDLKTYLHDNNLPYKITKRRTYENKTKQVLKIQVPKPHVFEGFVKAIEQATNYRVTLYNADIKPEQMYLYEHDLIPCTTLQDKESTVPLTTAHIHVEIQGDPRKDNTLPIQKIIINDQIIKGDEKTVLAQFKVLFEREDPDVLFMQNAFVNLPHLYARLQRHNIQCNLNRWDHQDIKYRGGKSFYTYGTVRYQDYAVRLKGRLLVDKATTIGTDCHLDALIEMAHLSGNCLQQVASRSYGAVFQSALVKEMVKDGYLVPYKEKPIDKPLSLIELVKADRVGHTYDSLTGFHTNVAELDFASMYPWVMYNHNLSAETLLFDGPPFHQAPGLNIKISHKKLGLVPKAIKPFIDKRMYYKKHPTIINRQKAVGLKWILVSSYGYLRFREFKLGIPTTHMAVGAYSRKILLDAAKKAEHSGYSIVHGVVDAIYIKKQNINEAEVQALRQEIQSKAKIPLTFEGIFKWIVFLPSINNSNRPVPTKYYGVFQSGELKIRGIEARKRTSPKLIKEFQTEIIQTMALHDTQEEIRADFTRYCAILRRYVKKLPTTNKKNLTIKIRISKTEYEKNIPQKFIVKQLNKQGISPLPGQVVKFIHTTKGPQLPEYYEKNPDLKYYTEKLIDALYVVLQPFGFTKIQIAEQSQEQRQMLLTEFKQRMHITQRYVTLKKSYDSMRGKSEQIIRRQLEKEGYIVWRGGAVNILKRKEVYPNVKRKYEQLFSLLDPQQKEKLQHIARAHKGMPDFLVYKNKQFTFIECKLCHEQLSQRQWRCIEKLADIGFKTEIHRVVDHRTKTRVAEIDIHTKTTKKVEKQATLTKKLLASKPV